jgi:hypothetical protein
MTGSGEGGGDWAPPGTSGPPPGWAAEQPPPVYPPPAPPPAPPPGWAPATAAGQWAPYAPGGWVQAPRPGIIPLRPLGVGEILDGAFTAIRRYPRSTIGLASVVMLVVTVVQVVTQWWLLSGVSTPSDTASASEVGDYFARVGAFAIVGLLLTQVAVLILSGMITAVIGDAVLGRPASIGDAWARFRPLLGRLIGVSLLTFLIVVVVMFVAVLPGLLALLAGAGGGAVALLVIGGIAGIVAAVWLFMALSLAPAVVVLERQGVLTSMRRSRALVRGSWWRVFGILVLAGLIASVVSGIISVPFALAGGGLGTFGRDSTDVTFSALVVGGIGRLIAAAVVRPFNAGILALLYIDRRMRAEALDVALTRAAAAPPS